VVGVLMSAAILLPVILTFIGDNRNGVQYPLTLLYDADFYRNFLAAYTTSHNQAYQTYLGFNAVALPAIGLLYFKRKPEEKPLRILFLLATAALLIPVFGWALNGFSYMANRWVWAYSLLVAYIVTTQWQKLRHITVGQAVACVGALALYSLLAIPLMTTDARNIGVSVLLAFLIIVLCALAPKFKKKHLATALVLVLVLTSFTGNAAYFYSSHGKHKTDTFVATEKVNRRIKGASGRKVKKAAKSDKSFYRYTGDNVECNEELLAHMSGSSFYWSLQNPNVAQYVTETEQPVENSYRYNRLNTSAALNALTGVSIMPPPSRPPHCPTALRRSKIKFIKAATPCPWATPMTAPLPGRIMKNCPRWRSNKPCCKGWYWTACPPARHKPLSPLRTSPCPTPSPQTKMWQ